MLYSLFSLICLALLCLIALGIFTKFLLRKSREGKIEFIRGFKKGDCVLVYLVAIPLYFMGYVYAGQGPLTAFFSAISETTTLVTLRYDLSDISALMEQNRLFEVTMYVCCFMVAVNAMLFTLSLVHQKLWELGQHVIWRMSRKERVLIVGCNDNNVQIYRSGDKRMCAILGDLSAKEKSELYAAKVRFFATGDEKGFCARMLTRHLRRARPAIIVINTQNDAKNLELARCIMQKTREHPASEQGTRIADVLTRVRVYVFGDPAHEALYHEITEESDGVVRYINKYFRIAMDFLTQHPFTLYMGKEQIDTEHFLIREEAELCVAMVGFGKTGRQIFLGSVANHQFLARENGKLCHKPVTYHIYDRQSSEKNKNLNHSYYRYQNELAREIALAENGTPSPDYLPLPPQPAREVYHKLDVNDPDFYQSIKDAFARRNVFGYIVIAFGTDLENIDMAYKLLQKKAEWGMDGVRIFVKVRNARHRFPIFARKDCFMIGDEQRAVYNINQIDDDALTAMAKLRNRVYALERAMANKKGKAFTEEEVKAIYAKADCEWFTEKTQFERESNLYACLALHTKLHLMGLRCVRATGKEKGLSEKEYLQRYAAGDMPQYLPDLLVEGKRVPRALLPNMQSHRTTMAIQEHYRWNAFMIAKGFLPADKRTILASEKNGKDYTLRRHGNLTTFTGLAEFREMIMARDGVDARQADVCKYDYQILDDAYWFLNKSGYVITEKE